MTKTKKIALLGICTALSMILSYIDSQIILYPSLPGIRLGLANTVTVFLMYRMSAFHACSVTLVRVILTSLLFYGNAVHIAYGLCGAVLSLCVMLLLKRTKLFSHTGVSIAGGVSHNVGQIACAALLTATQEILLYLPVLLVSGTLSGAGVGLVAAQVLSRTERIKR